MRSSALPPPASTRCRFSTTRLVCASTPSGSGAASSAGSVGICPVTKSQPSAATAWLNGATGVGAPATIRNSIMSQSSVASLGRRRAHRLLILGLTAGLGAPARVVDRVAAPRDDAGIGARMQLLTGDDGFEQALVLLRKQPVMHPRHPEDPEQALPERAPPALPAEQAPAMVVAALGIDRRYPAQREIIAVGPADERGARHQRRLAVLDAVFDDRLRLGVDLLAPAGRLQKAVPGLVLGWKCAEPGKLRRRDAV